MINHKKKGGEFGYLWATLFPMIIHAFKKKAIRTERIYEACPDCASYDCIEITVFQKYCRVFWVPTFTYGKSGMSKCVVCGHEHKIKELPESLRYAYENLKSETKTSPYFYIGTFIVLGFFLFVLLSVEIKSE